MDSASRRSRLVITSSAFVGRPSSPSTIDTVPSCITPSCDSSSTSGWFRIGGLYDMHGNNAGWCADWYDEKYFANSPLDDPPGAAGGSLRAAGGHFVERPALLPGGRTRWRRTRQPRLGPERKAQRVWCSGRQPVRVNTRVIASGSLPLSPSASVASLWCQRDWQHCSGLTDAERTGKEPPSLGDGCLRREGPFPNALWSRMRLLPDVSGVGPPSCTNPRYGI